MNSITEQLAQKYQKSYQAGKGHQECPSCSKETLSITPDDHYAKCFHAGCGYQYRCDDSPASAKTGYVHEFLAYILPITKSAVSPGTDPYSYLISGRFIDPYVVSIADVGAIPQSYDTVSIKTKLDEVIKKITDKIDFLTKSGEKKEAAVESEILDSVTVLGNNVINAFIKCPGFLVFFYTDEQYNFTYLRLRKPSTTDKIFFTIGRPYGVFGLTSNILDNKKNNQDSLLRFYPVLFAFEGEINLLCHQSYTRHTNILGMVTPSYALGSSSADPAIIPKLEKKYGRKSLLYRDGTNDTDPAATTLITHIQDFTSLYVSETTPHKDFADLYAHYWQSAVGGLDLLTQSYDEYRRGISMDIAKDWGAIKYVKYFRTPESVKEQINAILGSKAQQHTRNEQAAELLLPEILDRTKYEIGSDQRVYHTVEESYLYDFLDGTHVRLPITHTTAGYSPEYTRLSQPYINVTSSTSKYFSAHLQDYSIRHSPLVIIHRKMFYDRGTKVLYIQASPGTMYRIDAGSNVLVPNGSDGVLFVTEHVFEYVPVGERKKNTFYWLLNSLVYEDDRLSPDQLKKLLWHYIEYAIMRSSDMIRPLLNIVGPAGSAKSVLAESVGIILEGCDFYLSGVDTKENLELQISSRNYVSLDNVDNFYGWLGDVLAVAATGGSKDTRRLYTTTQMVTLKYDAFVCLTSRVPHLQREDISQRAILVNLGRLHSYDFSKEDIIGEIQDHRNSILSDFIDSIQTGLSQEKKISGQSRLGEFSYWLNDTDIEQAMVRSQRRFAAEDNVFCNLLPYIDISGFMTMREICDKMHTHCNDTHDRFNYANAPQKLQKAYKRFRDSLTEYYTIEEVMDSHIKVKKYKFTSKTPSQQAGIVDFLPDISEVLGGHHGGQKQIGGIECR